ncbi:hypothetical protein KC909_06750 [Candidatus Dojkabacteria bacterium]|uniref:Uncharacterized protein n=1 Tax=Candidatus Dojkabacteria bacterium TaxID=2099670 RepID=A0A955L713_9BACT|nr:hypothetical protein [Candidatus Dojkabacteria bacterium]
MQKAIVPLLVILIFVLILTNILYTYNGRYVGAFGILYSCTEEENQKFIEGSEELADYLVENYDFEIIDAPIGNMTSKKIFLSGSYKGYKNIVIDIRYSSEAERDANGCEWQAYVEHSKRSLSWNIDEEEQKIDELVNDIHNWYLDYSMENNL